MLVAIEWIYFNSVGARFSTLNNSFDILRHSVEIGLLAVAMTPIILAGGIDLSVGSVSGLAGAAFAVLNVNHYRTVAAHLGIEVPDEAIDRVPARGVQRRLHSLFAALSAVHGVGQRGADTAAGRS